MSFGSFAPVRGLFGSLNSSWANWSLPFDCGSSAGAAKLKADMQKRFPDHKIEFYRMHGATDARHFAELGVPIAILGSEGGGMHSAGEWVSLASLEDCRVLLSDFIRSI